MPKHAAADGAAAHPLVVAAMATRSPETHGSHRRGNPGPIGWPGTAPAEGGGLGWPGDLPARSDSRSLTAPHEEDAAAQPEGGDDADADPDGARSHGATSHRAAAQGAASGGVQRGWRRLFARRTAA